MEKLFLLDAYALIYRAYYALIRNPRINSKKQNTSAIFGFVNTLEEILQKESPTHIAVAFDPKGGTFRHEVYADYKAQRDETPEDIRASVPIIKDIIRAYNIEILEVPGYEADDVIGTIALEAGRRGFDTYMMTPDKDYGQLVTDNVRIYKPALGAKPAEVLGVEEVCAKYGIKSPEQVVDILGLMGDAADNVPGCPGVGEKTACTLMKQFDSIEQIYEDTSKVKGKLREKLENNKEQVLFSKFLTKIKTDVPIDFNEEMLLRKEPNIDALKEIFKELEFYSFLKRLAPGESGGAMTSAKDAKSASKGAKSASARRDAQTEQKNGPIQLDLFATEPYEIPSEEKETILSAVDLTNSNYQLIENEEEQAEILREFFTLEKFAFECAGTSLVALKSEIVGLALCGESGKAFFLNFAAGLKDNEKLQQLVKQLFENEASLKICNDLKAQAQILGGVGMTIAGDCFDVMLAHYILQPELKQALFQMADGYLGVQLLDPEVVYGAKWRNEQNSALVEPKVLAQYFGQRAEVVYALEPLLADKMEAEGTKKFYDETEVKLALVLADMERVGVKVDIDSLSETSRLFTARMNEYETQAHEESGVQFNVSSPKQVGEVLFDHLKLDPKAKKTKTGQYVTSEEVLEALRPNSKVVDNILKYRGMKKLLGTYVDALPALVNPTTGHIHSSFNQAVTATGRLSSSNPNLQNIPVRGDDGKEIRKAFIPDEGELFFSADYSQIELRIMAHLSGDEHMIDAFNQGHDIHTATAARIFHKELSEVTADERRKAKTANFGIIYGISAFGLAQRMGVSRTEAKELIDGYFATYTKIHDFIEQTKEKARSLGYIETIFKRRRYTPDINSHNSVVKGYAERNAVNAPIQGSASDIIKIAMVKIFERFKREGIKSKMILQVHDELNFSVRPEEKERVEQIVTQEMQGAVQLSVPLLADCGWGANWLEAH